MNLLLRSREGDRQQNKEGSNLGKFGTFFNDLFRILVKKRLLYKLRHVSLIFFFKMTGAANTSY